MRHLGKIGTNKQFLKTILYRSIFKIFNLISKCSQFVYVMVKYVNKRNYVIGRKILSFR